MVGEQADKRHDTRREPAFAEWFALGEGEALRLLYERYARRIRAYCLRRLGNDTDAEDALQETFLKAQQGLHRFDRDAPFWPWLVTIASHVCTDMQRVHERAADGEVDPGCVVEAEEDVARRKKISIVDEALRSLPDRYRTSLYMRYFEESSYEEIARLQGMSMASVRSTLMRSRRRLGSRIEALARAERQWPLPSTVSVVARRVRDRIRSWCREVGRMVQGAVGVIDSAVSFNALMANAHAALVAIGALGASVSGAQALGHHVPDASAVASGAGPSSAPLITIGDRHAAFTVETGVVKPPMFTLESPRPPVGPREMVPTVHAGAAGEGSLTVSVDLVVEDFRAETACSTRTPVIGDRCVVLRTAWAIVEQAPPTPVVGMADGGQ